MDVSCLELRRSFWLLSMVTLVSLHAQNLEADDEPIVYQTAAGAYADLGQTNHWYGAQIKQFLSLDHAVNAQILFGEKMMVIGVDYTFNGLIPVHILYKNLSWYAGLGGQVAFAKGDLKNAFALRPMVGLEFKTKKQPIVFHAELKPQWTFGETGHFELANFGVGLKYVLNRDIW